MLLLCNMNVKVFIFNIQISLLKLNLDSVMQKNCAKEKSEVGKFG